MIFIFICFSDIFAVSERRVLIMDFKNISQDPNYTYLEPSITEAVIKTLKKSFVFALFPEKEWKEVAKRNFFFEDSFSTPSIGMQLGLLGKQDIVIGGGFTIENNKIIAKVHILGIADRKILKSFEVTGYADSRIWDSVQKIADTVAAIAKDVLPNTQEWSSFAVQGRNQISIFAHVDPIPIPKARIEPLPSGTAFTINPNDFNLALKFAVDYMRIGLFTDNFALWGNLSYTMATRKFTASGHSPEVSTVAGKLDSYHVSAGIAYRVFQIQSFYVFPRLGAGFYYNTITMDFTTLNNPPSATTGNTDLTKLSANLTGVSLNADLILGYQLMEWLTAELMVQYEQVFLKPPVQYSNLFFALNLGVKF